MSKVLIVGWDGATFDVIRPLIAAGKLPNIAKMMQNGSWGTLRSIVPPVTPAAWTSFFTGKNPGKHGIYDFQDLNPETYEFRTVRTDRHKEKTLWQILGEQGLRSLVIDVPFTYPPKPLNGWMLTGYGTPRTPETIFTYPENLADLLPAALRGEVHVALPKNKFDRSQEFIDEWTEVMNGRQKLLRHLITTQNWDLFMVVFSITDNMAHVFWTYLDSEHPNYHKPEGEKFRNAFLNAYITCDTLLGQLMEAAGPDATTLVVSDHGFGSVRPRQYVFQRLMQGGYLSSATGQSRSLKSRAMQYATEIYMRFPFLREWVKSLRPQQLKAVQKSVKRASLMPTKGEDFVNSKIIVTNFGLRMWVNDTERFAQGKVPPAEKDALITELATYLKADRDPINGLPIIANVYRGTDLYHGPFADRGPDLVIEYANHYRPNPQKPGANPYTEGGHTLDGIFLASGTGVRASQGTEMASAQGLPSLIDLAPTILHLLDFPIPPDMDGRVMTEIFDPAWFASHPIRPGTEPARFADAGASQELSSAEEASVEDQLRRLGYI
ncbi:MAG: alkaline phosphatase family protein [Anaerolineales bacterium]|nr:alkaline phosphatase family protein [Anaerolineales bacterium]